MGWVNGDPFAALGAIDFCPCVSSSFAWYHARNVAAGYPVDPTQCQKNLSVILTNSAAQRKSLLGGREDPCLSGHIIKFLEQPFHHEHSPFVERHVAQRGEGSVKRTNICPGCRELRLVFEDGDSIGVCFYVEKRVYFGSPADIDRETAVSLKCRSIYAHVAERVALGVAEVSWENFYVFAGNFLSLITGRKAAQLEIMFFDG